jgi:spermidine/putrescine transport system substrate-binding protein
LIVTDLVQPLNPDYLPNVTNLWKGFRSPFYDRSSAYTIPYTVYTTGIGWRNDLVGDDIPAMQDPYDIFWDTRYTGKIYILDDYREALTMAILRGGSRDINTGDADLINGAGQALISLTDLVNVKWSLTDYTLLPEGGAWIHQAWSGDMVTAPYYGRNKPPEVAPTLSFAYQKDGRGVVGSDIVTIPRSAENPVLAHAFLNFLLDAKIAIHNFNWLGYQQPVESVTVEHVVRVYPWLGETNWSDALVTPAMADEGLRELELPPDADFLWQLAWTGFRAGA